MIDDFQVPDEYLGAFRHLVRRIPVEFQTDKDFLQTLVMYLKLGGEKLASHRIEVEKAEFKTAFTLAKRQPVEGSGDDESDADDEDRDAEDEDEDDKNGKNGKNGKNSGRGDKEDIDSDTIVS